MFLLDGIPAVYFDDTFSEDVLVDCVHRLIDLFAIDPKSTYEADYQASALVHLSSLDETYYARGRQRLEGLRNWAAGRAGK